MGTEITYHDLPKDEFDILEAKYPDGKYFSKGRYNWFTLTVVEMDLELTWWMKKERDGQ